MITRRVTLLVGGLLAVLTASASPAELAWGGPGMSVLRVREGTVPVEWRGGVALVDAERVTRLAGGSTSRQADGRVTLRVGTAQVELRTGLPLARVGAAVHPLAGAPDERGNALRVPLQVFSELVPRYDRALSFDRARGELRLPTAKAVVRRIVIDAGHGGTDPGMRGVLPNGRVIYEKDITLGVSRALAQTLQGRGHAVHLTRNRDTLIALDDRGRIANAQRGDLFLSIHVNAADPRARGGSSARGFETYFLAEAKTEDARRVAQMENEVVRFEAPVAAGANDPLSFIVNDMAQNEHLRESLELASAIQSGLARRHPGPNRGVKQAEFRVLVRAFMPAVLIELGFASNPNEAAWLNSTEGQRALAESIAEATEAYLAAYARRVGGTGS
jgi:N-acetylmuramoyl-L-alanine amidase